MKLIGADGQPIDVPDVDVPEAFLKGGAGLPAGTTVPMVAANGQIGHVPAEKAQEAFTAGARVATAEEIHKAELHKAYGDASGLFKATAAGLARGATVGLSDPLIEAVGGPEARQQLADLREESPIASGVAEGVGAIAPLLVSDGASAAVEGAEGAGALARAGEAGGAALRTAGAPTRALARAGEAASAGVRSLIGAPGESLAARVAQRAVEEGAAGATMGALQGIGSEISEDTLGDTELNGEKLLAAMGHGALLGAGAGILLGGTGELGSEVLGRLRPKVNAAADEQYLRALNPKEKYTRLAEEKFGGVKVIADRIRKEQFVAAGDKLETIAAKVEAGQESALDELRGVVKEVGSEGVPLQDVLGKLKAREAELAKDASAAGAEAAVRSLRERIEAIYTPAVKTELEQPQIVSLLKKAGGAGFTPEFLAKEGVTQEGDKLFGLVRPKPEAVTVPFEELLRQRRGIEKDLNWFADPSGSRGKKIAGRTIEDALVEAGDKLAQSEGARAGTDWKDRYLAAKKRFHEVSFINEIVDKSMAAGGARRIVSPSDYGVGMATAAGAIAAGHPLGMLHGIATSAVHHVIRERGNATAAVLLDKLSAIGGIQRAIRTVDKQIDRGILGILRPGERAAVRIREPAHATHAAHVQAVAQAASKPDEHADAIAAAVAPLAEHAPKTANAFQRAALRSSAVAAGAIPKQHQPTDSLTPQLEQPRMSEAEVAHSERVRAITHDPVGTTFAEIGKGTLTAEHVALFRATSPALYQQTANRMRAELATLKTALPLATEQQVRTLLGMPAAEPAFTRAMQSTYARPTPASSPGHVAKTPKQQATPTQRQQLSGAQRLAGLNDTGGL